MSWEVTVTEGGEIFWWRVFNVIVDPISRNMKPVKFGNALKAKVKLIWNYSEET